MLITYLNALKDKGNFTYATISKASGYPEATIKNIFTGKTEDPRLETISAIVSAMGGSLDAINSATHVKEEVESNAIITLKQTYETRIADLQLRYDEMKQGYKEHIETIKADKRRIWYVTCILGICLILILIIDAFVGHAGWIRY